MRIQQDMDVQNSYLIDQASVNSASKSSKNKGNVTISGANINGSSLITRRQELAKKTALKVISDAFSGEKKLDSQMQSITDEIHRLQDVITEKTNDRDYNDAILKDLQSEYGVKKDSKEHKEVEILAVKMRNPEIEVTEEELNSLTDYQKKALYYVTQNQQNSIDIDQMKSQLAGNVQGYADMKSERAKSQDMLNAQDAADDILEVANSETISLLTQDAVDHINEEQKEREEAAKEAEEKKKEEKKEAAKKLEKEAIQQEMIENIKEHASENGKSSSDIKKEIARREREEANTADIDDIEKAKSFDGTSIQDTQNAVNTEITNILNRLSLLPNDIKGTSIDSQL